MSQTVEMHIIARIHSDFPTKFGIPRQSGLADVPARIVFEPEYRNADALRGIEGFSHLWLIWQFSAAVRDGWSPTVRPPKLGGNKRIGVFATRSPFRPNEIGLSSVRQTAMPRGTQHAGRSGAAHFGRGSDGRHADFRHQAVSCVHRLASGGARRLCAHDQCRACGMSGKPARKAAAGTPSNPAERARAGPETGLSARGRPRVRVPVCGI